MSARLLTLSFPTTAPAQLPVHIGRQHQYLNTEASLIFKSYKNCLLMMADRGYSLSPSNEAIFQMETPDFVRHFLERAVSMDTSFEKQLSHVFVPPDLDPLEDNIDMVFSGDTESAEQIAVRKAATLDTVWVTFAHIGKAKSFSMEHYKRIIDQHEDQFVSIPHVIVVANKSPNKDVINKIREEASLTFEFFTYAELGFDPRTNFLNSQFIKLTETEVEMLREEMRASGDTLAKLPQISYQDKMARWYGARPGDILEVLRDDVGVDVMTDSSIAWRRVTTRSLPVYKAKS